jgi:hypothetical protein
MSAPLAAQNTMPQRTVRRGPRVSHMCPARCRMAKVAMYWRLTISPASTVFSPSVRCTYPGRIARVSPMAR